MADISITAANVVPPANAKLTTVIVAETVTAGMLLYYNSANGLWYKADALTAIKAGSGSVDSLRMAMGAATAGQPVAVLSPGQVVTLGAVLQQGRDYALSATATSGALTLISNLVNTNYRTYIGYALTSSTLQYDPLPSGIVLA